MKAEFKVVLEFPDEMSVLDLHDFFEELKCSIDDYRSGSKAAGKIDIEMSKKLKISI